MKAQPLNLNSEIFDDFRENLNLAINAVMKNLISKNMQGGGIAAKINIELKQKITEDGEVLYMPEIEPTVSLKIGAKGKLECKKQTGFLMKADDEDGFVIGSEQISMDELLDEQKGA